MPEIPGGQIGSTPDRLPVRSGSPDTTISPRTHSRLRRRLGTISAPLVASPQLSSAPEIVNWINTHGNAVVGTLLSLGGGLYLRHLYNKRRLKIEQEKAQTEQRLAREQSQTIQRIAREKARTEQRLASQRATDQRFKDIIAGLTHSGIDSKHAMAVQLLSFIKEGHERFNQQIFQIAVNYLRNRDVKKITKLNSPDPRKPVFTERLPSADQAFIQLFLEIIPRIRMNLEKGGQKITKEIAKKFLNASGVHLDGAQMMGARLRNVYMKDATFKNAHLESAILAKANLNGADFSGASLLGANLSDAMLIGANLTQSTLTAANLSQANMFWANLSRASIAEAILRNTNLAVTNLTETIIAWPINIDNMRRQPLAKRPAYRTNIFGAKGLTAEKRKLLLDMGAIEKK
ncbi:MAG TPA: pentapeptide repeat-containing protein [Patescibacteria group bacterium]|nr:pentapeptide repeat-containing protein [Patescibacteria group bacterium]